MGPEQEEAVTLHHLDQRSVPDALEGAQLFKAVECGAAQLEGEACAVAGDVMVHKHLVKLRHQHLARHLSVEEKRVRRREKKHL